MKLKKLLLLQLIYMILGIAYNLASYALLTSTGIPLAPTIPLIGAMVMLGYGLCLLPGVFRFITLYRILMFAAIFALGYGGVYKHVLNLFGNLPLYYSVWAWAGALGINLFGVILNISAAAGRFGADKK